MNDPFFSVVIPLYNKAPYILRAVNSVLDQTYQHFEIIVVDDGSTDGGGDLINEIQDPRIKLIHQENSGASTARNHGVLEAKTDYIAFLDADDEWKPELLSTFKKLVNSYPDSSFFAQSYIYFHNGQNIIPSSLGKIPRNWTGYLDNYIELASEFPPFFSSSVCIQKDLLIKSGGFPEGVSIVEDISMWLKLFFETRISFCHSLNSIYHHGETNNITLNQKIKFSYFESLLEQYLSNSAITAKIKKDLYEYYTSRILYVVSQNLLFESKDYCRSLLQKCNQTKRYKTRWNRLYLFSDLPKSIYRLLFYAWKRIRNF